MTAHHRVTPPKPEPRHFDYEAIEADYQRDLVECLRRFGHGDPILSLWVPDEDRWLGIQNLLDAAVLSGHYDLDLSLSDELRQTIGTTRLIELLHSFGQSEQLVDGEPQGPLRLRALKPRGPAGTAPVGVTPLPPRSRPTPVAEPLGSAYIAYFEQCPDVADERASMPPTNPSEANNTVVEICSQGIGLKVRIDHNDHRLLDLAFDISRPERGLERVMACARSCLVGLPIQEVAEHGAMRCEQRLRHELPSPPLPGIVLPRAAHPHFARLEDLLRQAYAAHCRSMGSTPPPNRFDPGVSETWLSYSEARRIELITEQLERFSAEVLGNKTVPRLVRLDGGFRVFVEFLHPAEADTKGHQAMALQRQLSESLEPRLELFLEERRDRNKLRRLAIVDRAEEHVR